MPNGGLITVTAVNRQVDGAEPLPNSDYVVISVHESGTGIAPELISQIF